MSKFVCPSCKNSCDSTSIDELGHSECTECGHCVSCDQPEGELYELYKDKMTKLWLDYEKVCDEVIARFENINKENANETIETFQWMIDNFKLPSISNEDQEKHVRLVDPFMFANRIQIVKDDNAFCAFIEIDGMLLNVNGQPKFLCNINEKATLVDYDHYQGFKQSADESE